MIRPTKILKIEKPKTEKPVVKPFAVKAKIAGTPMDEMMRWRRGQITLHNDRKITGYRKIFLGECLYLVNGVDFPAEQVHSFRRDEYICQPNQAYDPHAYQP